MKKTVCVLLISLLLLSGCAIGRKDKEKESSEPERTVIRLALSESGHILNSIAEDQGYLEEEGILVQYVTVDTDAEVFRGLRNGSIDIASNSGTNLPLQEIASGTDLTIFAGYLLTGCMPVFCRVETVWNSIESLMFKTVACEPNVYVLSGTLLGYGYDPIRDINWYETDNQYERIEAVKNGTADFGLVGTALNYEVIRDPELKIVTYAADIMAAYSCCRVEALTSWVQENPNTVKALLRAWIRAMAYYEQHHEEALPLLQKQTGQEEAVIRAYLDNPRFDLNIDPMKKSVKRAWNYMDRLGLLSDTTAQINIDDHINTELYKQALDECQERYGKENPLFYEKMQAQFSRNNEQK